MRPGETYFTILVRLPRVVGIEDRSDWLARELKALTKRTSFLGASEGSIAPATRILDAAEAPRDRDEFEGAEFLSVSFYFLNQDEAMHFYQHCRSLRLQCETSTDESKDWMEEWRKSFPGLEIPPYWKVVPSWQRENESTKHSKLQRLYLNPGLGFGSGSHPTTRLCLKRIGELGNLEGKHLLDFGTGSGILGVAAALHEAKVDAVEIDPLALEAATECAKLNQIQPRIQFARFLDDLPIRTYDVIVANILRPVLEDFANRLVERLSNRGTLILSGLLKSDVEPILERYVEAFLASGKPSFDLRQASEGEWHLIDWTLLGEG